ncbi:MAG: DMT family transporter [Ignavibacteriales bacterium]|nr:DMT family transporter [Ignavibacteriales bacterium]
MNSEHNPHRGAEALLLITVLIWALNAPLVKYGIGQMDVFVFNAIRFIVASSVIAALLFSRSTWKTVQRGDWWVLIRLGLITNVFYQLTFIFAFKLTTAGNGAVLMATSPLWTLLLNARLHHERVPRIAIVGSMVSLVGIALMIVGSGKEFELASGAIVGDALALVAAFLWALNTTMQKDALQRYSSVQTMLVSVGVGAACLSAAAVPSAISFPWSQIHFTQWFVPVISGGLSIGIAYVMWANGVRHIGPRKTGNYGNLIPVLAFVAASILLKEPVTIYHVSGASLTVGGVWIARH